MRCIYSRASLSFDVRSPPGASIALSPERITPSMRMLLTLLVATASCTASPLGVCPDKILPGTGIGGGGKVTSLNNVSSQAACCALCHGDFHDECSGWVYNGPGTRPGEQADGLQKHNCAIMATNGPPRPIEGHTTGINKDAPPPPPVPVGKPCNADIDCAPATAANWRCRQHTAPADASNNCHIPGPGTAGNNTCACSAQHCSNTSVTPGNASAHTQYLVIGDSISMGMNGDLAALVAGDGWALTHSPGNAASSNLGAHCVDGWVQAQARKWDVISYQFGLHDLGYDTERISVAQYTALLTEITAKLLAVQAKHKTKLLWVKTTPVPSEFRPPFCHPVVAQSRRAR
jgi:hypothetical protein